MSNQLETLTVKQLERAIVIRQQIEQLQSELASLGSAGEPQAAPTANGHRTMSPAARAKIVQAQKSRWAQAKEQPAPAVKSNKKKRTITAAWRAKIAAAQKARWAKIKATK